MTWPRGSTSTRWTCGCATCRPTTTTPRPTRSPSGATTCPGTSPVALNAATAARDELLRRIAPRLNAQPADLSIEPGHVVNRGANQRWPWRQACARLGMDTVEVTNNSLGQGLANNG